MEDKIYRVYTHTTPDGLKYVGVTGQDLSMRWISSHYKTTSLWPYIEQYGFDNLIHEVIYTCYDRKEAFEVEGEMVKYWDEKGICINKRRSGLICSDLKIYKKSYYENHREYKLQYVKKYREKHRDKIDEYQNAYHKTYHSKPEGKIYCRVNSYNHYHPDNITITPLEAKLEYVKYSFVPSFIKYDDIPNALPITPSDWEWCKNLN